MNFKRKKPREMGNAGRDSWGSGKERLLNIEEVEILQEKEETPPRKKRNGKEPKKRGCEKNNYGAHEYEWIDGEGWLYYPLQYGPYASKKLACKHCGKVDHDKTRAFQAEERRRLTEKCWKRQQKGGSG